MVNFFYFIWKKISFVLETATIIMTEGKGCSEKLFCLSLSLFLFLPAFIVTLFSTPPPSVSLCLPLHRIYGFFYFFIFILFILLFFPFRLPHCLWNLFCISRMWFMSLCCSPIVYLRNQQQQQHLSLYIYTTMISQHFTEKFLPKQSLPLNSWIFLFIFPLF